MAPVQLSELGLTRLILSDHDSRRKRASATLAESQASMRGAVHLLLRPYVGDGFRVRGKLAHGPIRRVSR